MPPSAGSSCHQVLPSVFVLYAAYRYGWGESTVGLTLAFVGVCSAIVQGLLIGPIVGRIGARLALLLGLLAGALGMAIYGLAPTGPWFYLGAPVMALWGLAGPAIQEMTSRLVSPSEQGQLQGAYSSSRSITGLVARALHRRLRLVAGLVAGCALPLGCGPIGRRGRRELGYYETVASRRPVGVSLHTSQSGLSGLLNHGSAQPRSRQRRTTAAATAWPSRSNSGSLPPGWTSPRRR
jgi:MFS family permease